MCVYIYIYVCVCVICIYVICIYVICIYLICIYVICIYVICIYVMSIMFVWSIVKPYNTTQRYSFTWPPQKGGAFDHGIWGIFMFFKTKKITILEASKKERMEKSMANSPMKPAFLANSSWFTSMAAMATVAKTAPFFNGSHGALTEKCPASNGLARHPGPRSSRQGWKASRCKASWTLRGLPPPMDRIW